MIVKNIKMSVICAILSINLLIPWDFIKQILNQPNIFIFVAIPSLFRSSSDAVAMARLERKGRLVENLEQAVTIAKY